MTTLPSSQVEAVQRPDAPYDLTDEQAEEWRAVVNRLPADWFPRETWGLLAQYCRHIVAARRVAQLVTACEAEADFDVVRYDKLLKMQEREGRGISSLASRMRIAQVSSMRHERVKKPSMIEKPWQRSA
jgi:hypothetical protein